MRDNRYFSETGYRIDLDPFWDYFNKRGGVRTFGYPVSWEFPLLGFQVQFFQRGILQLMPERGVVTMNLLNLELWGLPTSRPTRDPNNADLVYQRFQRGILHCEASTGVTQGLLLADYLKSIMTGEGLPFDLNLQAAESHFYRQYDRSRPGFLARPSELPGTNLSSAFEAEIPEISESPRV